MTPFEIVYSRSPLTVHCYECGSTPMAQVEDNLREQDTLLKLSREKLTTAQARMKLNADHHRRKQEFAPGDFMHLKLQPFQQLSIQFRGNMKLSPTFYGLLQVLKQIGTMAYCLELPPHSWLHSIFHVSQLKKQLGRSNRTVTKLLEVTDEGAIVL